MTTNGTNGHANPRITEQLTQLREQLKVARARAELTNLEASSFSRNWRLREGYDGHTGYTWGDLVDPMEADLQRHRECAKGR